MEQESPLLLDVVCTWQEVLKLRAFVLKKVYRTSIADAEAGASSDAFVAIKNLLFHSCNNKERALHSIMTSLSITDDVIEGVTKAVEDDLQTYSSPGGYYFLLGRVVVGHCTVLLDGTEGCTLSYELKTISTESVIPARDDKT
jgi:hypothetical protein